MSETTAPIVDKLRVAQLSKHELLFEALRRALERTGSPDDFATLTAAAKVLEETQAMQPNVVAELLALPQFGHWAADALFRLAPRNTTPRSSSPRDFSANLGYITLLAAAAALRTRHPFELEVPVHRSMVTLPTLGTFHLGSVAPGDRVRIRLADGPALVVSPTESLPLPTNFPHSPLELNPRWSPVRHLRVVADGLPLSVVLDQCDPFFEQFGAPIIRLSGQGEAIWQRRLAETWHLLASHHRQTAEALAAAVTTLVPLAELGTGRRASATSGWAWGAIALSLPPDPLAFAETLVHEFHHLVLGAIEDLVPLFGETDAQLYYAPWRDDPRPLRGMLQGTYAHLGVTAFWRRQRQASKRQNRMRAEVEFARWREATLQATNTIADSGSLTETGQSFVSAMRQRLAEFQGEAVSGRAIFLATDINLEHHVRWRLNHLRPDDAALDRLASAWIARLPAPPWAEVAIAQAKGVFSADRPYFPENHNRHSAHTQGCLRKRSRLRADIGVPHNEPGTSEHYLGRIQSGHDLGAWAGFILIRLRHAPTARTRSVLKRPELIMALHTRIRAYSQISPDPDALIAWLAKSAGVTPCPPAF